MEATFHDAMQKTPLWLFNEFHDSSSSLNVIVNRFIQDERCFNLNQSTEFRRVIFKDDMPFNIFLNEGMASWYWDICNSQVIIMTTSNFKAIFLTEIYHMQSLAHLIIDSWIWCLLISNGTRHLHGFQDNIVILGLLYLKYVVKPAI